MKIKRHKPWKTIKEGGSATQRALFLKLDMDTFQPYNLLPKVGEKIGYNLIDACYTAIKTYGKYGINKFEHRIKYITIAIQSNHMGISFCSIKDQYNGYLGKKIAYSRLMNDPIIMNSLNDEI